MATYGQVITRVRRILQDKTKVGLPTDEAEFRYSDEELLDTVNDAMTEVRRLRPDLFINSGFAVPEATSADNTILLEDYYFMCLVYMTAGMVMLQDDEFSLDSRAVNLLNKGTSQLLTTNA